MPLPFTHIYSDENDDIIFEDFARLRLRGANDSQTPGSATGATGLLAATGTANDLNIGGIL